MPIRFTGLASGLDTENIIKDLMKAERMKVDKVKKQKTKLEWKQDIWESFNAKIYSFYKDAVAKFRSKSTFLAKTALSSNENFVKASVNSQAAEGNHTVKVNQLAKGSFLTGDQLSNDRHGDPITEETKAEDLIDFGGATDKTLRISLDNGSNYTDITIEPTDNIAYITSKMREAADVNVSYSDSFSCLLASSKNQGAGVQLKFEGDDDLLTSLGFSSGKRTGSLGQDCKFEFNGTAFTADSNEVTISGITLTFNGTGETVSISVNKDTQAIYDNVKEFVTEYNNLLLEINDKVYADRITGYEPLTAEEKKEMSEDDIKLWEEKIKKSLLRRDGILMSLTNSMRKILNSSEGVDTTGFTYNDLSDLGIVTGPYKEKGLIHINGDEDDPIYATEKDLLRKAIDDDPDKVAELLSAIGDKLYTTMRDKMKSTRISSAFTFYNDKHIDKQIEDYTDEIEDLEEKLIGIEERYYRQFSAMEKAIQMMNNQSASLASMLGGAQ